MEPILALRMEEFNLSQDKIGLFFTIYPLFYILTNLLYAYFPLNVSRRYTLITASLLSAFVNLLVGPSKIAQLPNSLNVMIAGQALRGVIDPFLFIPVLPEMMASVTPYYNKNQEGLLNDSASGLFCTFYGLGMILGPILGSAVTAKYGF
jgi:MFS family permease